MKRQLMRVISELYAFLASDTFFYMVMVLFVFQAAWIALSAQLLPYDEYYHNGIISFYANQWSPFITQQSADMGLYGDVTRLPSYLYHYLMSFPYRLFAALFDAQTAFTLLRFINIAMVASAAGLFRRLFLRASVSKRAVNASVMIFVLLPIVPILAAQNNYDNLMLLLTPLFLTQTYTLVTSRFSLKAFLLLCTIGMAATLVKNNFIVVFGVIGVYVLWQLVGTRRSALIRDVQKSYKAIGWKVLLPYCVIFALFAGLFLERYGVNALQYGQVKVDCAKVQSAETCSQYSPWRRNQAALAQNLKAEESYSNPASFSIHWATTIVRGFNAVFANIVPEDLNQPDPYGHYVFRPVMPVMLVASYAGLIMCIIVLILQRRVIWKQQLFRLSVLGFFGLVIALWVFNYTFYLKYGRAYAVQSRYLLPFVLPMIILVIANIRPLLHVKKTYTHMATISVLMLLLWSGGIMGWIVRSEADWYANDAARQVNQAAQQILRKSTLH